MKVLFDKDYLDSGTKIEDLSRESIIVDLIPGIIHEINNSLASALASAELLQQEMGTLKKEINENKINLNLINHIEKLSSLKKTSTPRIHNIVSALLKEEIHKLKEECAKKNIEDSKFERLDKLISLNMNSTKRIDLISKAFRRLVSFEEDITLIDVNEVVNASLIILQDHLKNRYTIREEFSELPLVHFNFHQLNYSIICILLKTIELMNSGELHLKTFETEETIHININLIGGEISKECVDAMLSDGISKSKIDLNSINKLLQYKGGTLDIIKSNETLGSDINEMSGGLVFDIKIKKDHILGPDKTQLDPKDFLLEEDVLVDTNVSESKVEVYNIDKEHSESNNILVVDDDPETLVSLFLSLKHCNLSNKVIIAKTAEAGIEQLKERNFCLVISDYRLPGMDGISFLSYIKEKYPKTTRILITAYPNSVLKEEASTKASVKFFIEKPWVSKDLTKIMQQIEEINIKNI
ncbi:MAG: response regulator [Candidatus Methanofastidiosum sp.]|nr:response regulator [Methanofastidiosum sp.]